MTVTRDDRLFTQQAKIYLEEIEMLARRNLDLFNRQLDMEESIKRMIATAGHPDAVEACRLICVEGVRILESK